MNRFYRCDSSTRKGTRPNLTENDWSELQYFVFIYFTYLFVVLAMMEEVELYITDRSRTSEKRHGGMLLERI